jgi:hypothetical protein
MELTDRIGGQKRQFSVEFAKNAFFEGLEGDLRTRGYFCMGLEGEIGKFQSNAQGV